MVFVSCQFYLALFTVNSGSFFVFRLSCLFLNFSENLGIFRVALLFICQRSVILLLLLFSAATLISYHNRFRLSTTFFEIFFRLGKLCFPWQVFMLTYLSDFVNNFFWNLFKFLSSCCVVSALPQQRIWVYHPVPHLSTLFCIFFKQFCKSSKKAHNHGLFCHFGSYCLFSFSRNLQYICL